jgi:hypothetical protein
MKKGLKDATLWRLLNKEYTFIKKIKIIYRVPEERRRRGEGGAVKIYDLFFFVKS